MATVKAFIRSSKKDNFVNIRFRLSDGRNIQLFHTSEILVQPSIWDEKKEQYKSKVLIPIHCKTREEFYRDITERKNLILRLYTDHKIETSEQLNQYIDEYINPEKYINKESSESLHNRLNLYIEQCYKDGIFGEGRKKHYDVLLRELNRFLIINNLSDITPTDFNNEKLILFRDFLFNEYILVDKYRGLYVDMNNRNIPTSPRGQNTVATKLKKLQAFFNELESNDEIPVSPFRKLGKQRKTVMMKEQYDEPIFLTKAEFIKLQNTDVPNSLQETKDAFLLQCSLGCRIGDFQTLSFDNIAIEEDIPFIHYLPHKTLKENDTRIEIKTPLMRFALEIIKKYNFNFPILRYVSGERGYNDKIKVLLEYCKIDRLVAVFDEAKSKNEYKPLYEVASSKLARKTHVDLMNKVQVDKYAAGLHSKNSDAVNRYTKLGVKDRFILMCAAFDCNEYKVDNNLHII
jgi:integrase